jgi:hypothetical protein
MNTKHLVTLLALLSLLPGITLAKSPWDTSAATNESAPTEAASTEPSMVEPITAEPIAADEPMAAEPVATEPMADSQPASPESIEVFETSGDVLAMPHQAQNQADTSPVYLLDFPRRGMDQEKVQSELGAPVEIKSAVGQPPITRWIYNDRVVYFERSTVLHVVAR